MTIKALRERLRQSDWIVCSEALRILDDPPFDPPTGHAYASKMPCRCGACAAEVAE